MDSEGQLLLNNIQKVSVRDNNLIRIHNIVHSMGMQSIDASNNHLWISPVFLNEIIGAMQDSQAATMGGFRFLTDVNLASNRLDGPLDLSIIPNVEMVAPNMERLSLRGQPTDEYKRAPVGEIE